MTDNPSREQTDPPARLADAPTGTKAQAIAAHSLWFLLDSVVLTLVTFGVSVVVARAIGPTELGYFNYIGWLTNISRLIGSLGIPITTRKYMAESLGKGEHGIARAIYQHTAMRQTSVALVITAIGAVVILFVGDPRYRTVSLIQLASILPAMLCFIPTQALAANENIRVSVISSAISSIANCVGVMASLALGWGLLGISLSTLGSRTLEFLLRWYSVTQWLKRLPIAALPAELRQRMRSFSWHNTALMVLNAVVWDRSEVVFLKHMASSIEQVTFYTISFNLCERVLEVTHVFSMGLEVTMMTQYGRDKTQIPPLLAVAAKYLALVAAPLLIGLAALSSALVPLLYGEQYVPAIGVLFVSASLAVAKPLLQPATQFFQAFEKQALLLKLTCWFAALNLILDISLIPFMDARGAAIANGATQFAAVIAMWLVLIRQFAIPLDYGAVARICGASIAMGVPVWFLASMLNRWAAPLVCIPVAAVIYLLAIRALRVVNAGDVQRLLSLKRTVPCRLRGPYEKLVMFLNPAR